MFGGSLVSIGPPGGLQEGLFVDFGSPLRSSVGRGVVFEGQLDTPFGFKVPRKTGRARRARKARGRVGRVGHIGHVGHVGRVGHVTHRHVGHVGHLGHVIADCNL